MIPAASRKTFSAFTLIELLVVVAIILIMVAMLGNPHRGVKHKAQLVACLSNLKQISLGFILWADANINLFPWEVSTNAGGTQEMIEQEVAAGHFLPIKTRLPNPRLLICPTDKLRRASTSFSSFGNSNLSYFISPDVSLKSSPSPSSIILAGDRHLSFTN